MVYPVSKWTITINLYNFLFEYSSIFINIVLYKTDYEYGSCGSHRPKSITLHVPGRDILDQKTLHRMITKLANEEEISNDI